jgi:hypothetical protein
MVSQNVMRVLEEVQALSLEEQRQFRRLLDEQPAPQPELSKEEQLDQLLLSKGVISRIPPKPTEEDIARFNAWKPVPIEGKPLSETIIEDRR